MFGTENDPVQPAFAWAGGRGGQGWQPWARGPQAHDWNDPDGTPGETWMRGPGDPRWGRGPWGGPPMGRMFWRFARHFPFGPGMGPGPRMFGRGDLKYGLLGLLEERPKHGYEMIKELEDMTGGFYSPSAGAIYPTLQLLEDRGWVSVETVEDRKRYTITAAGREALREYRAQEERHGPWHMPHDFGAHHHHHGPFSPDARPQLRALALDAREVAQLMRMAVVNSGGDPERLARLRAIADHTRAELLAYLQEQNAARDPSPHSASGTAGNPAEGETRII